MLTAPGKSIADGVIRVMLLKLVSSPWTIDKNLSPEELNSLPVNRKVFRVDPVGISIAV